MRTFVLRRHVRRSSSSGFTLVELMVSLVAGVMIAVAVVALARTATNSFHEEVRMSAVEMGLRGASERLRGDLARAGFMGIGNIRWDDKCAHRTNQPCSRYGAETDDVQSIRLYRGRSKSAAGVYGSEGTYGLASKNGLNPDVIEISGNMTTSDAYRGQIITDGVAPSCAGQIVRIKTGDDPALTRLFQNTTSTATATALLKAAFTPGTGRFLARVVDNLGFAQVVPVCSVVAVNTTTAEIELARDAQNDAILGAGEAASAGAAGGTQGTGGASAQETVTINPLTTVQWYIGANTDPILAPDVEIEPAANKFNLYRAVLNTAGVAVRTELVSEYAVDLKFGIVAHDAFNVDPTKRYVVVDMDDPTTNMDPWVSAATSTLERKEGPQRIRSVRYRISMRSQLPDRTQLVSVAPGPYIARYCIENVPLANCKQFTRVRTFVSEVSLFNQGRNFY